MEWPDFNAPMRTNIEDMTQEQAAAINAQLTRTLRRLEQVMNNVTTSQHKAFLQVTEEVGEDDRLTEFMRAHIQQDKWIDPQYSAILETIQPGSMQLVTKKQGAILDEQHRQELRQIRSPKNLARLLFKGTRSIRF